MRSFGLHSKLQAVLGYSVSQQKGEEGQMEMMGGGGKAWGRGGKRSREMKQRRREDEKQKEIS